MTITISELKKPGVYYDSSKLSILLNRVTGSMSTRTNNAYIAKGKIQGLTMKITVLKLNPETGKYSPPLRNEQDLLAGRVSNFLNSNGVSHKIQVN